MAGEGAPFSLTLGAIIDAAIAAADSPGGFIVAPFDGVITASSVVPTATLTGANTDSRTIQLFNRGQAGAGVLMPASKAFVSGVNAPIRDETALTLSGTASDLVVAAGDVLEFISLHVGATGLAAPKMIGRVTISRTAGS